MFVLLIWRSKETGIKAQACDEGGPVGQCRRQCVNSKAAVADKDEIASRQPAAELQQALSRPVCQQFMLLSFLLVVSL